MFLRPDGRDLRIIGYYLGRVATGLALLMAVPAALALVLGEWSPASALIAGASLCVLLGRVAEARLATRASLTWGHGTVVVALAWLLGSLLVAVPFALSGHVDSLLDAWFEAMSGLTTSGLSVVSDLDHLPYSFNLYRHLTHFAGGQGIVIVMLALATTGGGAIGTLFVAEGRDERIVPSVVRTARFIFLIAAAYLAVGTFTLTVALWGSGFTGWRSLWHAFNLFLAAFDTGGFTLGSQSIAYYHSGVVEVVLVVLMVAGALSFALHYQLWLGRAEELTSNLEVRSLAVTLFVFMTIALYGLVAAGTHLDAGQLFRKGFFTMVSAHSGTGFAVTSGGLFVSDWGVIAPAAVVVAMALGGMAGSTAGGIKAIRLALTLKGLVQDIRRLLLPEHALQVTTYHSGQRRILRGPTLRAATAVLLLYVVTYLVGAGIGLLYGQGDVTRTLFESVSAAANVGLSVGIVDPAMPAGLQVTYIVQMWLGRLEFMAAFALIGYLWSLARSGQHRRSAA